MFFTLAGAGGSEARRSSLPAFRIRADGLQPGHLVDLRRFAFNSLEELPGVATDFAKSTPQSRPIRASMRVRCMMGHGEYTPCACPFNTCVAIPTNREGRKNVAIGEQSSVAFHVQSEAFASQNFLR